MIEKKTSRTPHPSIVVKKENKASRIRPTSNKIFFEEIEIFDT